MPSHHHPKQSNNNGGWGWGLNSNFYSDLSLAAAAQMPPSAAIIPSTNPRTAAGLIMGGYSQASLAPPLSAALDEYYLSQAKIHQVYVNNAVAASAVAAVSASGAGGVPSPATLSMMRGLFFDQHHHHPPPPNNVADNFLQQQQQQYHGQQPLMMNDHHLSYYYQNNNSATTTATAPMNHNHVNAHTTTAANYAVSLRHQQHHHHQSQQLRPSHNTLFLPSDANFLSEAHCFLRFVCIELFTSTEQHLTAGGRGARPSHVGQVGFRCIHCKNQSRDNQANQAVSFPFTRDNIFESVRNFQRVHLDSCPFIPQTIKLTYHEIIHKGNHTPKRSHKLVRAYYSQAASEMGLIDTPFGLRYRDECGYKQRATPSQEMLTILEAANAEEKEGTRFLEPFRVNNNKAASSLKDDNTRSSSSSSSGGNASAVAIANDVKFGKFDALSSKLTKQVILNARKEHNVFVQPQDFPTISDFIFLLFHQLKPCKPMFNKKRRRSSTTGSSFDREHPNSNNAISMPFAGLCCKHCQKEDNENPNGVGMYFPSNVECLGDSSFSQTFLMHLMSSCPHVPQDIKHALTELKNLAREYNASVKRGSKKKFVERVWNRLGCYAKKNSGAASGVVGTCASKI